MTLRSAATWTFLAALPAVAGCGAADDAERVAARAEELVNQRACLRTRPEACPAVEAIHDVSQLVVDDCYDVVSIDAGPDASCCFEVTVELSVGAALDCL